MIHPHNSNIMVNHWECWIHRSLLFVFLVMRSMVMCRLTITTRGTWEGSLEQSYDRFHMTPLTVETCSRWLVQVLALMQHNVRMTQQIIFTGPFTRVILHAAWKELKEEKMINRLNLRDQCQSISLFHLHYVSLRLSSRLSLYFYEPRDTLSLRHRSRNAGIVKR